MLLCSDELFVFVVALGGGGGLIGACCAFVSDKRLFEPLCFLARRGDRPGRECPYGVAPFEAVGPPAIIEYEAHRACRGDSSPKARHAGVIGDTIVASTVCCWRRLERPHQPVG